MFAHLHKQALTAALKFKSAEIELIDLLQKIDACRGFEELGYPSLFAYVNQALGLSEACTQQLITVSRKARQVPELRNAIEAGQITVAKAKSMVSVITPENQEQWLTRARESSTRELEREVAKVTGPVGIKITVDDEALAALRRVQELLAQKCGKHVTLADAVKELATIYVQKNDPVVKADRTLHVKGSVHRRDRGKCQHKMPNRKICGASHWLHVHHIRHKSKGGSDEPQNLLTLCSAHHRQIHRYFKGKVVTQEIARAPGW